MGLNIGLNSTLGGGFLLSLLAFFSGNATNNERLTHAAEPFVWIFGIVWALFIVLTLVRNVRSLA